MDLVRESEKGSGCSSRMDTDTGSETNFNDNRGSMRDDNDDAMDGYKRDTGDVYERRFVDRGRSRSPDRRRDEGRGRDRDRGERRDYRRGEGRPRQNRERRGSQSHPLVQDPTPSATLYVTGFINGTSARRLAEVFEKYGPLGEVTVLPPRRGDGEQFGFVMFRNTADMEAVLDSISRGVILDDGLAINIVKGIECQRAKQSRSRAGGRERDYRSQDGRRDMRGPQRGNRHSIHRRPSDPRDCDPRDTRDGGDSRDRDRDRGGEDGYSRERSGTLPSFSGSR